jgi:hypothetical protein
LAAITKVGNPTLASAEVDPNHQTTGLTAGEALGAWDACYIKQSDGKVYKSTGAAANAAAEVHGYASKAYVSGATYVTIYHGGMNVPYGTGLTPGKDVFLSEVTAGALADAVGAAGGTRKLGFVVDATRIRFYSVQGR